MNLADAEHRHFSFRQHIHQHRARRLDGVVMTPLRALEIARRAGERPGNYAPHAMLAIEHFASDIADAIKLSNGQHIFVRRNLEDAIARGVHDGVAGAHVLFAQFLDDFGAGGGLIAERFSADRALVLLD